ncbi:putative lipoprotein with Yx(FWY)xxD motif [Streptacidiphilus sp. MAP12-16]|uniref:COG4315 family predicted lipoprotein n=1 Tax=Streptacidiphilus sp. MAP12-16 TaxID=3156300 RepID=UPI003511C76E
MKIVSSAAVVLAAVALTATACSSSTPSNGGASASAPATQPASSAPGSSNASGSSTASGTATGASVAVRTTPLGKILVDGQGRTLYLFEKDTSMSSTCNGACASAWPPYTTSGAPQPGSGVTAALLGTTARTDNTTEVTYHGHPLYTFTGDQKPGDTNGQGSKAFGAGWYVVAPNGNKVDNS